MYSNFKPKLAAMLSVVAVVSSLFLISCTKKDESAATSQAPEKVTIQNAGSDTMVNLAQAWAEAYASLESKVSVEVSGGGSGTGIAALINGTVDIANCSRAIKAVEKERLSKIRAKSHKS